MTTIFKVMKRKWQKKTIRILRGRDAQPWMLLFLFFCCDQTLYIKTKCAHCLLPDESLKHMTESLTKKEKKSIEQKHKQSLSRFSHVSDNFENLIARIVAIILIDDDHETITTRKLRKLKTKIEKKINTRRIFSAHFFPRPFVFQRWKRFLLQFGFLGSHTKVSSTTIDSIIHKTCNHSLCWNQVQF